MPRLRGARPIPLTIPLADWSYSIVGHEAPTHKRIIVRDDTADAILWQQSWQQAQAQLQPNGQWFWSYTAPRTRISAVKTAKLAGTTVTVEFWVRYADGREVEDFTFDLTVA